ncbi:arsenate reductase [Shimia sp. R10_1]|uniref:ArsC/Spx/MgsR family protein n=1 Tax=Shimia sp. R10_1 TaxID=2821095 RepID=UPI001ADAA086|nr:ArsC/Spx/MgsR family protein [Shimia sp. R10_1]MBO9472452.1 arsenate reductase [Shimia sp. R10_1]
MTKLYGLKNCDTCRKAMKSLGEVVFVDVRQEGVPDLVLEKAFEQFKDALLNRKSTKWRNLSEEDRAQAPLVLLKAHPTLMKRPLIDRDGVYYLGWSKDVQAALL